MTAVEKLRNYLNQSFTRFLSNPAKTVQERVELRTLIEVHKIAFGLPDQLAELEKQYVADTSAHIEDRDFGRNN